MFKELAEDYMPEQHLHRKREYQELEQAFINYRDQGFSSNYLIQGTTGTGKTSLIKSLILKYNNSRYYDCKHILTAKKLIKVISGLSNGTATDFLNKIMKDFKENKSLLIIDEIGTITDIIRLGDYLNTIYRATSCPIIVITNKFRFLDKLPEDARLTLLFEKIIFKPYDQYQLFDILKDRLENLQKNNNSINYPIEALGQISCIVEDDFNSSVRVLLSLANKCLLNRNFSKDFISRSCHRIMMDEMAVFIEGRLTKSEKRFLGLLLEYMKEQNKEEISTFNFQKMFPKYSASRLSQLITSLVNFDIIHIEEINKGKMGGKFRVIKFHSEQQKAEIYQLLHPEEFINEEMPCV